MPVFEMNKLVRDGLRTLYEELGQVATYRVLSQEEHIAELQHKWDEEFTELEAASLVDKTKEAADCAQVLIDLENLGQHEAVSTYRGLLRGYMTTYRIDTGLVEELRQEAFLKKQGFSGGTYLVRLELRDDDEWVRYYRRDPDRYKEVA